MPLWFYIGLGGVVLILVIGSFMLGSSSYSKKGKQTHGDDKKDWYESTNQQMRRTGGRK